MVNDTGDGEYNDLAKAAVEYANNGATLTQGNVDFIKKKTGEALKKNIGRIFRRHNIVEYKSPKDYLGINDFYKVYAYACHYLAMSKQVKDISADELTITFVS